jgi:hypothetical protein
MRVFERFPTTTLKQRPRNILDFNVLIDLDRCLEIDAFMRQECSSNASVFHQYTPSVTLMQLARRYLDYQETDEFESLLEGFTLVNLNKGTRTKKSNRNFVTSAIAIEKLKASASSPLNRFVFSKEAIQPVRRKRFEGLKKNSDEKIRNLLEIGHTLGYSQRQIFDLIEENFNENQSSKDTILFSKSEPWILVMRKNHVQGNGLKYLKIKKKKVL